MNRLRRFAPLFALAALGLFWARGDAQRPEPKVHGVFDGDSMYTVLPLDAIPAIREPTYLTGEEADAQVSADEPVTGVVVVKRARA